MFIRNTWNDCKTVKLYCYLYHSVRLRQLVIKWWPWYYAASFRFFSYVTMRVKYVVDGGTLTGLCFYEAVPQGLVKVQKRKKNKPSTTAILSIRTDSTSLLNINMLIIGETKCTAILLSIYRCINKPSLTGRGKKTTSRAVQTTLGLISKKYKACTRLTRNDNASQ